ncbi:MAG: hypothetical protein GW859_02530 [Sphingomonadales bacterium]|nr:hypothetical protein [Sphingomonadales bacterium]
MTNDYARYACIALVVLVVAAIGERRRMRRKNIERVGFMPWPLITVLASLAFAVFAGIAVRGG